MHVLLLILCSVGIVIVLSLIEFYGKYPNLPAIWEKTSDEELNHTTLVQCSDGFRSHLKGKTFLYCYDRHPSTEKLEVTFRRGLLFRERTVLRANFKGDRVLWWKEENGPSGKGAYPDEERMLFETLARVQLAIQRHPPEESNATYFDRQ